MFPSLAYKQLKEMFLSAADIRYGKDVMRWFGDFRVKAQQSIIVPADASQVFMAYEQIDARLRQNLAPPDQNTTWEAFVDNVRAHKSLWTELYKRDDRKRDDSQNQQQLRRQAPQRGRGQYMSEFPNYLPFSPRIQNYRQGLPSRRPYFSSNVLPRF